MDYRPIGPISEHQENLAHETERLRLEEREIIKKSYPKVMRFAFIHGHQHEWPLSKGWAGSTTTGILTACRQYHARRRSKRRRSMSREELRLILGIAVAMEKNSMTDGQETLSCPFNPSRKSAQPSDSDCYSMKLCAGHNERYIFINYFQ
ncbi:hypothetical protein [Novacetimonas hansenii]|uniref:hypothetical protein n=1 Tax=Novacetimonas hansenii TaxID=436 RepID=UPI000AB655F6|nr:hypothetical protein [Novacetimonas hansenii]